MISAPTSFIMLRRDSSSLIPREKVRFLGEPLLSRATESMFGVCEIVIWAKNTPVCPRLVALLCRLFPTQLRVSSRRPGLVLRQAKAPKKARPRSAYSLREVDCFTASQGCERETPGIILYVVLFECHTNSYLEIINRRKRAN